MISTKIVSRPCHMIKLLEKSKNASHCVGVSGDYLIHTTAAHSKAKSKMTGNPNLQPHIKDKLSIPRWQHFWLLMMKRKYEIEGDAPPKPRLDEFNWDYEAELSAFAARLGIEVESGILRRAFMEPIESEEDSHELDNEELVQTGREFVDTVVELYLKELLPKVSPECFTSCKNYLISEDILSYVAQNLGYPDLVQSTEFPLPNITLKRCFLATVAAMAVSPGDKIQAARFVLDFVLTQLVGKDILHDIWKPQNPMGILVKEMESRGLEKPEVRLTKQSGITTVTPVYFTGIFSGKKFIVESGGETIIKAETDAAKLALKKMYGISVNQFVPNFESLKNNRIENEIMKLTVDIVHSPTVEAEKKDKAAEASPTKRRGFFLR